MAQPSSSHHDRERHRSERSSHSHRHHRTISSTTLLLILSLILAVLAVMLSLPAGTISGNTNSNNNDQQVESKDGGLLAYLSPKRTQQLITRESAIAVREAEVARREAEMLAGAPGGIVPAPPVVACPVCPTAIETVFAPAQTVIKEIVKEESLAPPGWNGARAEELFDRELKIAERERDITKREESVNRREHDASRREAWIMEQLIALGNDHPQRVDEEYVYEPVEAPPPPPKRKVKKPRDAPIVVAETAYETEIKTVVQTETITVPAPASTRRAHHPIPEPVTPSMSTGIPRTTSVEIVHEEFEEEEEEEEEETTVIRRARPNRRPPSGWFGGW